MSYTSYYTDVDNYILALVKALVGNHNLKNVIDIEKNLIEKHGLGIRYQIYSSIVGLCNLVLINHYRLFKKGMFKKFDIRFCLMNNQDVKKISPKLCLKILSKLKFGLLEDNIAFTNKLLTILIEARNV